MGAGLGTAAAVTVESMPNMLKAVSFMTAVMSGEG